MSEDSHQDFTSGSKRPGSDRSIKKQSMGPYLAVIAALALGLCFCIYIIIRGNEGESNETAKDKTAEVSQSTAAADEKEKTGDIVDVDKINQAAEARPIEEQSGGEEIDPNSILAKIGGTLQKYYAASSPEEKLKYVIDSERIAPLMRDLYFRSPLRANTLVNMSLPQSFPFKGYAFWRVEVTFANGAKGFAALRLIDGEPKVDWESEVRYSTMDWDKWVGSEPGTEGIFRVYAVIDQTYPAPFDDRSKYICVKLKRMDSSLTVFGYLTISDPDQVSLIQQIAGGQMQECTLKLKRAKSDSPSPLAEVVKVMSPSWIVVPENEES